MCRKHLGSLFGSGLGVARAAFRWLHGADGIVHYRATEAFERPFCGRCGSTVPAVSHDEGYWHVPAGLLPDDLDARPRSHIFFASRSPLTEIGDALPKHAGYPPGIALPPAAPALAPATQAAVAGSCLCGAVAFAASQSPRRLLNCHCSLCRRKSAAAFGSTLQVPQEAFHFVQGTERIAHYAPSAPRRYATDHCSNCGSPVPSASAGAFVGLPAGTIDTPLPPLPAAHFYVGSKAAWYEIGDAWPRFDARPPPERLTELLQPSRL
jgi:hypothetical protein